VERRAFLGAVTGGLLAAPLAAEGQEAGKVWQIGWLDITPPTTPVTRKSQDVFVQALRDRGFIEGHNVFFERRYSEGREERHTAFVYNLTRRGR